MLTYNGFTSSIYGRSICIRGLKQTGFSIGSRRLYAKSSHQRKANVGLSKSKKNHLEAPSKPTVFSFGNFSKLKKPDAKFKEQSERLITKITNFDELRIFPTVRVSMVEEIKAGYVLKNPNINTKHDVKIDPTPVQIAAIKKINQKRRVKNREKVKSDSQKIFEELSEQNESNRLKVFTIAAETGSGKTWSYLAPALSKMKEEEFEAFKTSPQAYKELLTQKSIRCLILLPTYELVDQVHRSIAKASKIPYDAENILESSNSKDPLLKDFLRNHMNNTCLNFNVVKWTHGDSHKSILGSSVPRIDVLITTPTKLKSLTDLVNIERPFAKFGSVSYCVVDEADTLLDESWLKDTSLVLQKIRKCKDLVFCSATIPREFSRTLEQMFPAKDSLIHIVTPSLHKIPKKINLKVIDAELPPYNGSKVRCLAQAIYAIANDGTEYGYVKRIVVFVNQKKDVKPLMDTLVARFGHNPDDIVAVSGNDSPEVRANAIRPFINPSEQINVKDKSKMKVLITTDLLARGLDFTGVKNIILMDLPKTSADLVHRIGRTGRMRQSGRVFIIIDKKTGKSWVKGLPRIITMGVPLG